MASLGTAACPPYHLAFVIGGTSAETCLKTVKLASTHYYDELPTSGNEHGRAFRDIELEQELLATARELGIGAQFGGKYFALDVRVIRLPRHGASCPVGIGVSCSADRQAKAKITKDGIFLEKLEKNPGRFIPEKFRDWKFKGVPIDLDLGMDETLKTLSKYPVTTALALTGTIIVARDIAHAKLKEILDDNGELPEYFRKYPVYYAGPAKTPPGMPSGSFGPTTAGRMDSYVDQFQACGGSMVMLAKGNRSKQTRRLLPRIRGRSCGIARQGAHPFAGSCRVPRTRDGGGVENHGGKLPRVHFGGRQGQRLFHLAELLPGLSLSGDVRDEWKIVPRFMVNALQADSATLHSSQQQHYHHGTYWNAGNDYDFHHNLVALRSEKIARTCSWNRQEHG
jgi:tartrate dehydratase beta subunit/fumarate hydratase class I family protein